MRTFIIAPVSRRLQKQLQEKIDLKTKPLRALGDLEDIALKVGLIQNSLTPELRKPHLIVFAADHGIAQEGVSAYPQEVTYQMVMNFLQGGAAINVFCRQHGISLKVVDAGVNYDFPARPPLIHAKIAKGTKNFLHQKAMTTDECTLAIARGSDLVSKVARDGCNVIGFGEMGIGNTSSASMLMSLFCGLPVGQCVGRGTGLKDIQLQQKIDILKRALANLKPEINNPLDVLATFGGFEIAMICGAILQAAQRKMLILIDGFIVTAAFLAAFKINGNVLDYAVFCHQSDENGHAHMLRYLNVRPILRLNLRLGEGTGAAVAYPIVQSAVYFLKEMASFESAGVSNKEE